MSVILNDYTDIDEVFERYGVQKPFLCCGKSFQNSDAFEYIKKFNPVIFDHIRPNPRFEDMIDGAELFNREGCDFIIAAGGGSPMDSAKMIRLMTTNDIATCLEQPMENNDIKALFIPTTAGTGAEATKSSVFYVNEVDKFSIANYDFIPDYVILDEKLLFTVPDYQRKCTCLDALCHAIESFWSAKATDESREYATKAIELFVQNKVRMKFKGEMVREDSSYRIVFCKVLKKDTTKFEEALEKLKRKMLLLGYRDYPDACSEITKIFEKGMEAGERSETICDN